MRDTFDNRVMRESSPQGNLYRCLETVIRKEMFMQCSNKLCQKDLNDV